MSNMRIIDIGSYKLCISYNTLVAYQYKPTNEYFITTGKYSNTTTKHVNKFLKANDWPTTKDIGEYALVTI